MLLRRGHYTYTVPIFPVNPPSGPVFFPIQVTLLEHGCTVLLKHRHPAMRQRVQLTRVWSSNHNLSLFHIDQPIISLFLGCLQLNVYTLFVLYVYPWVHRQHYAKMAIILPNYIIVSMCATLWNWYAHIFIAFDKANTAENALLNILFRDWHIVQRWTQVPNLEQFG